MRFPSPYNYYSALSSNKRLISYYAKRIEDLGYLVIYGKLDSEIELFQQERDRIKNDFDINDPNKYKKLEDTTKYHPLALEYYKVQQHLQPYYNNQLCNLTTDMQSLAVKGELLFSFSRAGIVGFNEKLEKLISKDHRQYEKTFYEIFVAGQFLLHGHKVRFIETSSKKSADILIDDSVEIECKSKDMVHPYYRKYQDLWYTIMMTKTPEWMERMRVNYLISIVFEKEIDGESVKLIKNKIHEIIYKTGSGMFPIDNGKALIQAKLLLPYNHDVDKPLTDETFPDIMKDIPVDFDFMQQIFTLYPTRERLTQRNFRFVAMKIPHHPKRSIISNLKSAASQLNKSLPSIIYIDISYINKGMKILELDSLRLDVNNFLKSNPSINAVAITDTYMTEINRTPELINGIWVIRNSFAKHTLPDTFRLPNEINSAKESLISDKYLV